MSAITLFPLHTVLYPGGDLPLKIFEARYVDLVSACLRDGQGFGIAPIRRGHEVGMPAETHPLGTFARIVDWDQGRDSLLHITVHGTARFRILAVAHRANGLIDADIEWFEDGEDPPLPNDDGFLSRLFTALWQRFAPERPAPDALRSRSLCYRLAEMLPFDAETRIALLGEPAASAQLRLIEREVLAISAGGT